MGSIPATGTYSASRVSAVIGLNQYQTPAEAWQKLMEEFKPGFNESKSYAMPEPPDSAAIRWGYAFEDAVIKLAEERDGLKIFNQEELYTKKIEDITLSCHIDGDFLQLPTDAVKNFQEDKGPILHEGKTTNSRAFYSIKDEKRRWGEPGTDEVPEEYQIQAAVQRICTGANLVKLAVLVFPKPQQEFEDEGWEIKENEHGFFMQKEEFEKQPRHWAHSLAEMGFFHTYNLPSNPELEQAVIKAIQDFHKNHILTEIPPPAEKYDDIRRLVTNPIGTIIATPDLKEKCVKYSEVTRQLGASGPLSKNKEELKVSILNEVMGGYRDDWSDPPDKVVILDPEGGDVLINFSNKEGKSRFSAKRAK